MKGHIWFDDVRSVNEKLLEAIQKGEPATLDLGECVLVFRLLADFILPMENSL